MDIKRLNKKKSPTITLDKSLEKYKKLPLFQEKVDKANKILSKAGVPKFK